MSAGRWRRSPPRERAVWRGRDRRSGPSSCWRSRASSIPRARRRASTPPGRTATSPTARDVDMTARIEAQIERFAPGFRDRILARHTMTAPQMEALQRQLRRRRHQRRRGGSAQLFTRPVATLDLADRYATPNQRAVSLLVVHPAGRRRARACAAIRGARRAARRLGLRRRPGSLRRLNRSFAVCDGGIWR